MAIPSLKTYQVILFGGLGIVAATALLPQTSWIFRNQIDLLTNGWQLNGASTGSSDPDGVFPDRIMRPESWHGTGRAELATWLNTIPGPNSFDIRTAKIEAYCQAHPDDVGAWGQLVRTLSIVATVPVKESIKPDPVRERYLKQLVAACDRGARLDQNNAFFPFAKSAALYRLGEREASLKALRQAGEATKYDDYTNYAVGVLQAAVNETYGYRGNLIGTQVLAGVTFPHITAFDSFGKRLAREARARSDFGTLFALLSVSRHMLLESDSAIGVFSARAILAASIRSDVSVRSNGQPVASLLPDAERFDRESGQGTVGQDAARMFDGLSKALASPPWLQNYDLFPWMSLRTAYGSTLLLALASVPVLLFLGAWMANRKGTRLEEAARSLCWLVAIPLAVAMPNLGGIALCAIVAAVVLASLSFFQQGRGIRDVLSALFLAAMLGLCLWDIHVVFVAVAGLCALGSSRLTHPAWQTILTVLGAAMVGIAFTAVLLMRNDLGSASFQAMVAILATASFVRVKNESLWRNGSLAVAIFAAAYLFTVGWELRADRQLAAMNAAFANEADALRQEAAL